MTVKSTKKKKKKKSMSERRVFEGALPLTYYQRVGKSLSAEDAVVLLNLVRLLLAREVISLDVDAQPRLPLDESDTGFKLRYMRNRRPSQFYTTLPVEVGCLLLDIKRERERFQVL